MTRNIGTKKAVVTHIPDERFREIVLSATQGREVPAVLSAEESEHCCNCPECIERLGNIARQIFQNEGINWLKA